MAGVLPVTESRDSSRTKASSITERVERDPQSLPFLKEDTFTDTILVIEGRRIYTHRSLLGYASPDFTKLLNSAHSAALAEKKSKAEIRIDGKNFADFVDMFSFFHPGVCKDLTEKMALRLLPLADFYNMAALKDRCERLLVAVLKKTPMPSRNTKGPPTLLNRKDNSTSKMLETYLKVADKGNSKLLLDQLIKMFSNPDIALKDLKANNEISASTKSKIFENRMDAASNKLSRITVELDREKHEKEQLKKQLSERFVKKSQIPRYGSEPTIEKSHPSPVSGPSRQHHHYYTHQRQDKYAENILGPVTQFSRDDFKDGLTHRSLIKSDKGDL